MSKSIFKITLVCLLMIPTFYARESIMAEEAAIDAMTLANWYADGDKGMLATKQMSLKGNNTFAISNVASGAFIYEADVSIMSEDTIASLVFSVPEVVWESYRLELNPMSNKIAIVGPNSFYFDYQIESAVNLNTIYHLKLTLDEHELKVYWDHDSEPVIRVSTPNQALDAGKLGLHLYKGSEGGGEVEFQNIKVSDLDSEILSAHIILTDWDLDGDPGQLQQNGLLLEGGNTFAISDTVAAAFTLEADVKVMSADTNASLVFHSPTHVWDSYRLELNPTVNKIALVGPNSFYYGYEIENGIELDELYHVKIIVDEPNINVFWENSADPVMSVSNPNEVAGALGLHLFNGNGGAGKAEFYNIKLELPASEPEPEPELEPKPISPFLNNLIDWKDNEEDWSLHANGLKGNALEAAIYRTAVMLEANFVLEGDIIIEPGASAGLFFRGNEDASAGYIVKLDPSDNSIQLVKADGTPIGNAITSIPLAYNQKHHIEIIVQGHNMTVYIDGYSSQAAMLQAVDGSYINDRVGLFVESGSAYFQDVYLTPLKDYYNEMYRPQYHYSPARGSASDPNGLVYFEGEYHLFHQDGGQWAHAISTDLVHWKRMPIALKWNELGHIWSGSAVADMNNASGLFDDSGGKGLIAYYTSFNPDKPGGNQKVGLAYSKDKGRTWIYDEGDAIVPNPGGPKGDWDFRDPKVVWDEQYNRWIMVVSGGDNIHFYISNDLINWERTDQFGFNEIKDDSGEWVEGVWECPDFFQLEVDDSGTKKWVLMISTGGHWKTKGSDGKYFIGEFTAAGKFINENPERTILRNDFGKEFYASMSFYNEPQQRRIVLGWMTNWDYPFSFPTTGWQGQLTIPRELSLKSTIAGIRLVQKPIEELKTLRTLVSDQKDMIVHHNTPNILAGIRGNAYEIIAEIEWPSIGKSPEFGFLLREGEEQHTIVGYHPDENKMFVDRAASGKTNFTSNFTTFHEAYVPAENNRMKFHIFVDESSIEVFGKDGETVFSSLIFPDSARSGMSFYVEGEGEVTVSSLEVYLLEDIWNKDEIDGNVVNKIVLDRDMLELGVGDTRRMFANTLPFSALNKKLIWETSDPNIVQVVKVDENSASINALQAGKATITAKTADGSVSADMAVIVGNFATNLTGWQAYSNSEWIPTLNGIRGTFDKDANYMSSEQAMDFTYEVDVIMPAKGAGSILFRANADGTSGYYFNIDPNMQSVRLFYMAQGQYEERQLLAKVPIEWEIGKTYRIKIVTQGFNMKIFLDDALMIDVTDETYLQGYFGLNVFDGQAYYQNVNIVEATPVDSRQYQFVNMLGNKVLTAGNEHNNSVLDVQLNHSLDGQKWFFYKLGDDVNSGYTIRTVDSGKSLDWNIANDTLQLYSYLGYDNQRWLFLEHNDGTVTVESKFDGNKVLKATEEGDLRVGERNESSLGQRWKIAELPFPQNPEDNNDDVAGSKGTDNENLNESIVIRIDGLSVNIATVNIDRSSTLPVTLIQFELAKLEAWLATQPMNAVMDIYVADDSNISLSGISADSLKRIADMGIEITIHSPNLIMPLHVNLLDWKALQQWSENAQFESIQFRLDIEQIAEPIYNQMKTQEAASGYTLLTKPITVHPIFSYLDREIEGIYRGNAFKQMVIPENLGLQQKLTAVAINEQGNLYHLPTTIVAQNDPNVETSGLLAQINDMANHRSYALVSYTSEFNDIENHWIRNTADNLGDRMIMQGNGKGEFGPNRLITRSEFTTIIVRGLGLMGANVEFSKLTDLQLDTWDYAAISIANHYGIISGYGDGSFRGSDPITREEGMMAIFNAISFIKGETTKPLDIEPNEVDSHLSKYKDSIQISPWAKEALAYMDMQGIVKGDDEGRIAPTGSLTRAEAAALIFRVLKMNSLID